MHARNYTDAFQAMHSHHCLEDCLQPISTCRHLNSGDQQRGQMQCTPTPLRPGVSLPMAGSSGPCQLPTSSCQASSLRAAGWASPWSSRQRTPGPGLQSNGLWSSLSWRCVGLQDVGGSRPPLAQTWRWIWTRAMRRTTCQHCCCTCHSWRLQAVSSRLIAWLSRPAGSTAAPMRT